MPPSQVALLLVGALIAGCGIVVFASDPYEGAPAALLLIGSGSVLVASGLLGTDRTWRKTLRVAALLMLLAAALLFGLLLIAGDSIG